MVELVTERLFLRPLEVEDASQVQSLFPEWEVVRLLAKTFAWPYPADGALRYYRDVALPAMARGEEWHWTLRLKSAPDAVIGAICLARGEANRGFWLGRRWWGCGLMTEAVDAVTGYWFDVLGFEVLRVPKAVENVASRRISERQGMRVVGVTEKEYLAGWRATEVWEMTVAEWRGRASR